MPIGAVLGGAAALAGTASSVNSLVGGGPGSTGGFSSGTQAPQAYIPQNQAAADSSYWSTVGQLGQYGNSLPGQTLPGITSAVNNLTANPYAGYAQFTANQGAGYGTGYTPPSFFSPAQGTPSVGGQPGQPSMSLPASTGAPGAAPAAGTGFDITNPATWGSTGYSSTDVQGGSGHDFSASVNAFLAQGMQPQQAWQAASQLFTSQGLGSFIPSTTGAAAAPGAAAPAAQAQPVAAPQPTGQPSVAGMQQQGASTLQGLGGLSASVAPQIVQSAFDPQSALYNQQLQQITDQSNAINSMYGLGTSPAGAGLTTQAVNNFNTQWQNQQLGREVQGAQGLASLGNSATQGYTGASNLGGSALNTLTTAGQLPQSTYSGNQNNIIAALNALTSGTTGSLQPDQNTLQALASYLGLGQAAVGIGQAGAAQNFNQQQAGLNNLSGALGTLAPSISGLFSNNTNPGDFTNAYSTSSTPGYNTGQYYGGYADPSTGYAIGP